tara:strand:- start:75 stop:1844 length:1770 start_codon:yes stop_codon:yes gene_type:complete
MVREFSADVKEIRNILRTDDSTYIIPRYQRGYSWKRPQISALWDDMMEEEFGLFIGTILLNQGDDREDRVQIIDGQQRLLTITVLLSSIRDALEKIGGGGAERRAGKIQLMYIQDEEYEDRINKIQTARKIRDFFDEVIVEPRRGRKVREAITDEEKRVRAARAFFDSKISGYTKGIKGEVEKITHLESLIKRVEKLSVVAINVENPEDAYKVFESVNAKGAALTLADILKSLIFRRIPPTSEEDSAQVQWDKINSNLEGTGFSISKFIRYYWLSKYGFLTESKLYSAIKDKLEKEKGLTWGELLDDLVSNSRSLKRLKEADHEDFTNYRSPRKISNGLKGISLMNVSQVYVLLLAIHRNQSMKEKWEREIEVLERFCFNYHAIGKQQAVRVEKKYSQYAIEIEKLNELEDGGMDHGKRAGMLEEILKGMISDFKGVKGEYVTHDVFISRFVEELDYSKPAKRGMIKYALQRINNHYTGGTGELSIDETMVNLEHVLPQRPAEWGLSETDVEEYVNRIGNLTLLSKKLNSQAGNMPLKGKFPKLEESELEITKRLVEYIKDSGMAWNRKMILDRSTNLASLSYNEIWKL